MKSRKYVLIRLLAFIGLTFLLSLNVVQAGELHKAIVDGDLGSVEALIQSGSDLNKKDRVLGAPLHYAASKGSLDIVRILVEKGAELDITTRGSAKKTALHLAAGNGHAEVVEYLLGQGMDVNSLSSLGTTAMHEAATANAVNVMEVLVKQNANLNIQEEYKEHTALHVAVELGFVDATAFLLESGANPNLNDDRGHSPLHLSMNVSSFNAAGGADLINLLLEKGATGLDDAIKWKKSYPEHGDEKLIEILDQLQN